MESLGGELCFSGSRHWCFERTPQRNCILSITAAMPAVSDIHLSFLFLALGWQSQNLQCMCTSWQRCAPLVQYEAPLWLVGPCTHCMFYIWGRAKIHTDLKQEWQQQLNRYIQSVLEWSWWRVRTTTFNEMIDKSWYLVGVMAKADIYYSCHLLVHNKIITILHQMHWTRVIHVSTKHALRQCRLNLTYPT